jgi:hypothetical protein
MISRRTGHRCRNNRRSSLRFPRDCRAARYRSATRRFSLAGQASSIQAAIWEAPGADPRLFAAHNRRNTRTSARKRAARKLVSRPEAAAACAVGASSAHPAPSPAAPTTPAAAARSTRGGGESSAGARASNVGSAGSSARANSKRCLAAARRFSALRSALAICSLALFTARLSRRTSSAARWTVACIARRSLLCMRPDAPRGPAPRAPAAVPRDPSAASSLGARSC